MSDKTLFFNSLFDVCETSDIAECGINSESTYLLACKFPQDLSQKFIDLEPYGFGAAEKEDGSLNSNFMP